MTDSIRKAFFKWVETQNSNDLIGYEALLQVWQAAQADARAFKTRLLEAIYPDGIKHPQQTEDDWIIDTVKQRADARALVGELVAVLKFADENLYEINVNNYDHDEVCHLNSMSVEVAVSVQEALTKAQAFMEGK